MVGSSQECDVWYVPSWLSRLTSGIHSGSSPVITAPGSSCVKTVRRIRLIEDIQSSVIYTHTFIHVYEWDINIPWWKSIFFSVTIKITGIPGQTINAIDSHPHHAIEKNLFLLFFFFLSFLSIFCCCWGGGYYNLKVVCTGSSVPGVVYLQGQLLSWHPVARGGVLCYRYP